jgi:hypothetical protein
MSLCSRCHAVFDCALADGSATPCWCTLLPPRVPVPDTVPGAVADAVTGAAAGAVPDALADAVPDAAALCWCPACLQAHLAALAATDSGQA